MSTPDADPLTTAELDALDALNRARTPGLLALDDYGLNDRLILFVPTGACVARLADDALARVAVAALNALPALLAEVRASRAAPAPYLIEALDAYGRAFCRAAHLDTQARRTALADAERAVLRCVEVVAK